MKIRPGSRDSDKVIKISPQKGPQEEFLSSSADIAIYGGAAGAGKSFALLIEVMRHNNIGQFGAVIFRREMPQITTEGGLWDTACELYSPLNTKAVRTPHLVHIFPSGAKCSFRQLQYDDSVRAWDGSQIPLIGFDELQHFTEKQFFAMLARNRSTCGVRPYVRGTCNPDPDSFLRKFLSWWIDQETGFPIYERSGKIRWFVRFDNVIYWADSKEELLKEWVPIKGADAVFPKSVTFIPAKVTDNKKLLEANPEYMGNLHALPEYEKLRLLGGNWFARPSAGDLFKRHYFKIVEKDEVPYLPDKLRYWDRAGTTPSDDNPDPDYTAGAKVAIDERGRIFVLDVCRDRLEPFDVETLIKANAMIDGQDVKVGIEQDPGQAGKAEAGYYIRNLIGYDVEAYPKIKNKLSYWRPLAAQAKAGNVYLVRGEWNEAFLTEAEAVTDGTQKGHDDQVDAVAGAFMVLAGELGGTAHASVDVM